MARTPKIVEDRKEQILDAAMRVFAQKGFNRTTNKDIAQEAGITPGLIYHYFANKEALLKELMAERSPARVLRTASPQLLEQPPAAFFHFLIMQVLSVADGEQFSQFARIFLPEVLHNPGIAPVSISFLQDVIAFIANYLQTQMDRGVIRSMDASLTAQTIVGCVIGFIMRRIVFQDPQAKQYTHAQIADTIISTTMQGLLPRQ
ncbi:TetR/AcrR family transcriptional regulator [Ktedonosporobacter rubrisoli]|uniref:TetR/AcrR family transcriptional regulator n=1 Tax=Ktedonosporobacter rubrisoli TaxID=2509675 RepID=A0A4P6JVH9_KTERU|nr:TetR/AcrR family transcriptional regulator [Ktedonosporobacter rubrisoli]QBD79340.1 TetR/AcrR family transcriptional regulator [Ktedonosporobacter rubrisoli]